MQCMDSRLRGNDKYFDVPRKQHFLIILIIMETQKCSRVF
jgi:hypothetical protein